MTILDNFFKIDTSIENRYIDRSVSIFEQNNAGFVLGTQKLIQNDLQHDYIGHFFFKIDISVHRSIDRYRFWKNGKNVCFFIFDSLSNAS